MGTTTNQVPSQPVHRKRIFGILALILSLSPIAFFSCGYGILLLLQSYPPLNTLSREILGPDYSNYYANFSLSLICLGTIVPFFGVLLGITSLVRKETRKGFAISGIVLGILSGSVMCVVLVAFWGMARGG